MYTVFLKYSMNIKTTKQLMLGSFKRPHFQGT
jgi:hypothetical protein